MAEGSAFNAETTVHVYSLWCLEQLSGELTMIRVCHVRQKLEVCVQIKVDSPPPKKKKRRKNEWTSVVAHFVGGQRLSGWE